MNHCLSCDVLLTQKNSLINTHGESQYNYVQSVYLILVFKEYTLMIHYMKRKLMNEGHFVKNIPCPKCRENGNDRSGDNLAIYSNGNSWCWSCHYFESSNLASSRLHNKGVNVALILLGM